LVTGRVSSSFAPEAKGVTMRVMFDVGPRIPKNSNAKAAGHSE
jgi:hypothetical protein